MSFNRAYHFMFKYLVTSIFLLLFTVTVFGQSFYVASDYNIKLLTISGNTYTEQNITTCTGSSGIAAIAINKNKFYRSYFNILTVGTIVGNQVTNCRSYSTDYFNALTVDKNGIVYGSNYNVLFKMDPANNYTAVIVGTMPFISGGDLMFYKDELYMAASGGIVKVDIKDPSKSTLVVPTASNIYGLAAVGYSSNANIVYALASNFSKTDVYQVDLDNKTLSAKIITLPFESYDAASIVEDGLTLPGIKIVKIDQAADCPFTGNGNVVITTDNALTGYNYTIDGTTNMSGRFTGLTPGDHYLTVTVGNDRKDTVIVIPDYKAIAPVVSYVKKDVVCDSKGNVKFNLSASSTLYKIVFNGVSYPYDHEFNGLDSGAYKFDVILPSGCLFDTYNITVGKEDCLVLNYPNTFTPNGDGVNDVFIHLASSTANKLTLRVFNRYGVVVFISTNTYTGWNGQYKGQNAPEGVYYWVASYTDSKGAVQTKKGYVALLR